MSDIIAENSGSIRAVALRNPFTMQRIDRAFLPGMTLAEMLADLDFPDYCTVLVSVDGDIVPQEMHAHYMPRPGQFVTFRAIPAGGGGGKNPLRTVLMLAVVVASAYTGNWVGVTKGFGALGGAAATVAVGAVGSLLVNAIAPPPSPAATAGAQTYKDSPSYAIGGGRNVVNPYGPIPQLLGRSRVWPPMLPPYTENSGNDQYLICYFLISKGQTIISDLKIGETALSQYSDVEIEIFDGSDSAESTLYPNDVYQEDMSVVLAAADGYTTRTTAANTSRISVDITYPRGLLQIDTQGRRSSVLSQVELQYAVAGSGVWLGSLTGSAVAEQTIDIQDPADVYGIGEQQNCLLIMDKLTGALSVVKGEHWGIGYYTTTGGDDDLTVYIPGYGDPALFPTAPDWAHPIATFYGSNVYGLTDARPAAFVAAGEFAATKEVIVGTRTSVVVAAGTLASTMFVTAGKTSSAIRKTYSFPVTAGQYDVRLRRVSADTDDDTIFDEVAWTALRSFQAGSPILEEDMARVVLRIKATEQLNGTIDTFSCIAQIVCPDYDTTSGTWIERATSNPASLYRHALQGRANKRPLADSHIDLDILEYWHDRCREHGWTFNHYVDYRSSVQDMLQMIAAAGRASPGYVDGKYAVVMDRPQTNIAQHFTPRNTWGYQYSKTFTDLPHAFRVKFKNRDAGWQDDERIVYDDGYNAGNATKFEELTLPGIDTADLAYKHARYHIACARLQPETHSFMCDFEGLTCTRGDRVQFAQDVIMVGLAYGRVKSFTADPSTVLTITLDAEMTMEAGKTYGLRIRQEDGTSLSIPLTTAVGISDTVSVAITWTTIPDIGALAMYGETDLESMPLIVSRIEHTGDLTMRIHCLPYAPAVHVADTGTIPAFSTYITNPAPLFRFELYTPVISRIRSDEATIIIYASGDVESRIAVAFASSDIPAGLVDRTQVRYRISGDEGPYAISETTTSEAILAPVIDGEEYTIEARYLIDGKWGKWCTAETATAFDAAAFADEPPPPITGFRLERTANTILASWSAPAEYRYVSFYEVWVKEGDGPWYVYTTVQGTSAAIVISNMSAITYTVGISARSVFVRYSTLTGGEIVGPEPEPEPEPVSSPRVEEEIATTPVSDEEDAPATAPPFIPTLRYTVSSGIITLTWNTIAEPQISTYEVRRGAKGAAWGVSVKIGESLTGSFSYAVDEAFPVYYVAAKYTSGNYGPPYPLVDLQTLGSIARISVKIREPDIDISWPSVTGATSYRLIIEAGGVAEMIRVTSPRHKMQIPRYDILVRVQALGDDGRFSDWTEEEIEIEGVYEQNIIVDLPINFINGTYINMCFTAANQVRRPSIAGSTVALPVLNINDCDLFNFGEGLKDVLSSAIESIPSEWFRSQWWRPQDGYFESPVYDFGSVLSGRIILSLTSSVTNLGSDIDSWDFVQAEYLADFTALHLVDTRAHLDADVYISADGTTWKAVKNQDMVTSVRYAKIVAKVLYASPLTEIQLASGNISLDVPDIVEDGYENIAGGFVDVVFAKSFTSVRTVICNAEGSAAAWATGVTATGFRLNVSVAGTNAYWFAKGY